MKQPRVDYKDLKEGDVLRFPHSKIEIELSAFQGRDGAVFHQHLQHYHVPECVKKTILPERIAIQNLGSRGYGQRRHIKIFLYDPEESYELLRATELQPA